jgi:hypothetical protein
MRGALPAEEPDARFPVSCCLSAVGIRFLGHPAPAAELSVPHGRPTSGRPPDRNGVVVLHMSKTRSGRAPPLPRGRWCAPGRRLSSGRHPPLFRGQSLRPRWNIPSAGVTFTRRHQGFTRVRPSPRGGRLPPPGREAPHASRRSSPRLPPSDGTRTASASTPGFAPRGYPRSTPRRRRAHAHWPGYCTFGTSRTSNGASHFTHAPSRRTQP